MKALKIIILIFAILAAIFIVFNLVGISSTFVKNIVLKKLSDVLNREIKAQEFVLYPLKGVYVKGLYIQTKGNLFLRADAASVKYDLKDILKRSLNLHVFLSQVKLQSREQTLIKVLFDAISLGNIEVFDFDTVDIKLLLEPAVIKIEDFQAQGHDVKIYAHGLSKRDKSIDFDVQIMLSDRLVEAAPNLFKEIFVIDQHNGYKTISAKIGGSFQRPSVNLRTDLLRFNLNVIERVIDGD